MKDSPFHLLTAPEIEDRFGAGYFYRQRIYRLAEKGKIPAFKHRDQSCFLPSHVLKAFLKDLELKIASKFPDFSQIYMIEINPFVDSTSPCLFDWKNDINILLNGPFEFRIRESLPDKSMYDSLGKQWRSLVVKEV